MVQLIQGAKDRGHRAYVNVDMDRVRRKAEALPNNSVPPELLRILPHDDDLDKIIVQKAATPAASRSDLPGAGQLLQNLKLLQLQKS